jgi:hypothetical protein
MHSAASSIPCLSLCSLYLQNYLLTEQQQLDVLGGLNAVLLEVLLYLLAARPGCALLGAHGAAHDDGLEGAQGHGAAPINHLEFSATKQALDQ